MLRLLAAIAVLMTAQSAVAQSAWTVVPSNTPQARIVSATWGDGTTIVARCDAGQPTTFVRFSDRMTGPAAYVLTQRESDIPIGGWWPVSDDGFSAVSRNPNYLLRDLSQGGRLDIVLKTRDAPDREMTLALPDQTAELESVMSDCGVAARPNPARHQQTLTRWKTRPGVQSNDFPQAALEADVSGQVAVNCLVSATSQPVSCIVVDEAPTGMGFGAAAVRIVSRGELEVPEPSADLGDIPAFTTRIRMTTTPGSEPDLVFADRIATETKGLWPEQEP